MFSKTVLLKTYDRDAFLFIFSRVVSLCGWNHCHVFVFVIAVVCLCICVVGIFVRNSFQSLISSVMFGVDA